MYSDTITVSLIHVEAGITQSGNQFNAVAVGTQYQWVDCLSAFDPISGETNATFTPNQTGEYAVEVTENGCTEISDCIEYIETPFINYSSDSVNCFPNPTLGGVTLQFGAEKELIEIRVFSILGQLLLDIKAQNKSKVEIDLPSAAAIYKIHVETEEIDRLFRIVKN